MNDLVNMNQPFELSIKICRICWSKVTMQDADPLYEPLDDGFTIAEILEAISNIKVIKHTQNYNVMDLFNFRLKKIAV